jgi:hypothetical protein
MALVMAMVVVLAPSASAVSKMACPIHWLTHIHVFEMALY